MQKTQKNLKIKKGIKTNSIQNTELPKNISDIIAIRQNELNQKVNPKISPTNNAVSNETWIGGMFINFLLVSGKIFNSNIKAKNPKTITNTPLTNNDLQTSILAINTEKQIQNLINTNPPILDIITINNDSKTIKKRNISLIDVNDEALIPFSSEENVILISLKITQY